MYVYILCQLCSNTSAYIIFTRQQNEFGSSTIDSINYDHQLLKIYSYDQFSLQILQHKTV
jgi:hypothetical protein